MTRGSARVGLPLWGALSRRLQLVTVLAIAGFLVLLLRLWQLQVMDGERYRAMAAANRLRVQRLMAPRGVIVDRAGRILAENRPAFDVYLTPGDVQDPGAEAALLGRILDLPGARVADWILGSQGRLWEALLLAKDVGEAAMMVLAERQADLPGVQVRVRPVRNYLRAAGAAPLLGHVGEVTREQLGRPEFADFRPGDQIGQRGVEARFDAFLRGMDGGEQLEVDAVGRTARPLGHVEPASGLNVSLTLDAEIQRAAEEALGDRAGAIVALDPRTGEVLAWVSRPAFDPNAFARPLPPDRWRELAADPKHPFQNRPVQAQYPPGSIFKLVVAAAGLEAGALRTDTRFTCTGSFVLGGHTFDCWKRPCVWRLDLVEAIARSCNVYFYQAALRIGIRPIADAARRLGLGQSPGMGLDPEASGLVPDPGWKQRSLGGPWFPGDTVVTAIGQGMVLATPLQLVMAISAIANGGVLYRPWVVRRVGTLEGRAVEEYGPEVIRRVGFRPETLLVLQEGMRRAVAEGTGRRAAVPGVPVAGKTGTAQVVAKGRRAAGLAPADHAWFAGFAPAEDPRIAVVVLVEHGGAGGQAAAPVAASVLAAAVPPARPLLATASPSSPAPKRRPAGAGAGT